MRYRYSTMGRGHSTVKTIPIQSLSKRTILLVAAGLALLGIVLGTIGGLWLFNVYSFVQTAERTEGTVVAIGENRNAKGDRVKYPVIEFTDQQGQQREFKARSGSDSSGYSVGNKVQILYDRDRPDSASLDSWVSLYLGPLVFIALAAGFLFFGIMFFITGLGKAKNREDVAW